MSTANNREGRSRNKMGIAAKDTWKLYPAGNKKY
jgi:hypothetical protein